MSQLSDKKDICYLTGEEQVISDNHPKGVVAATYGAKLISANDDQGYTYRGRFQNASQPYALGYEASQNPQRADLVGKEPGGRAAELRQREHLSAGILRGRKHQIFLTHLDCMKKMRK